MSTNETKNAKRRAANYRRPIGAVVPQAVVTETVGITTAVPPPPTAWRAGDACREPNGRWKRGVPGGPGRMRKLDLVRLATEHSRLNGTTLEHSVWTVVAKMFELAQAGDYNVGRYLLDRLCEHDDPEGTKRASLGVAVGAGGQVAIQVVTGVPRSDDASDDDALQLPAPDVSRSPLLD